jgi:hypothetical protein
MVKNLAARQCGGRELVLLLAHCYIEQQAKDGEGKYAEDNWLGWEVARGRFSQKMCMHKQSLT